MCERTQQSPAQYPSMRGRLEGVNQSGSQAAGNTTAGAENGGEATTRSSLHRSRHSLRVRVGVGCARVYECVCLIWQVLHDAAQNIYNSNLGETGQEIWPPLSFLPLPAA